MVSVTDPEVEPRDDGEPWGGASKELRKLLREAAAKGSASLDAFDGKDTA